jgi:hypothetical protein
LVGGGPCDAGLRWIKRAAALIDQSFGRTWFALKTFAWHRLATF